MLDKLQWIAIAIGILLIIPCAYFRTRSESLWRFFLGLLCIELGLGFSFMVALSIVRDRAYYLTLMGGEHGTVSYEAAPAFFVFTQSINALLSIFVLAIGVRCLLGYSPWRPK